jgi:hypothetical protein
MQAPLDSNIRLVQKFYLTQTLSALGAFLIDLEVLEFSANQFWRGIAPPGSRGAKILQKQNRNRQGEMRQGDQVVLGAFPSQTNRNHFTGKAELAQGGFAHRHCRRDFSLRL